MSGNNKDKTSTEILAENPQFLQQQLITYIGNKRALLSFIGEGVEIVKKKLGKEKLCCLDLFAGSGIVSRYLKQHASFIAANDLELYSSIINSCYLTNKNDISQEQLHKLHVQLLKQIDEKMRQLEKKADFKSAGFISQFYSPLDEENIKAGERCFYTPYNAAYIDVARQLIEETISPEFRNFFVAPLLSQASIHANTAGIFKGFYKNSVTKTGQFGGNGKNALSRIKGKITLPFPVFSEFDCVSRVFRQNANELVLQPELYEFCSKKAASIEQVFDFVYLDPPYNQHPYGSNYFMLNMIAKYQKPDESQLSKVSGIPQDWNRSDYNKKRKAAETFVELVQTVRAKYVLVSFNSEGFIARQEMINLLSNCGKVQVLEADYNTFRGSRNLNARNIHLKEFLFLVEKK